MNFDTPLKLPRVCKCDLCRTTDEMNRIAALLPDAEGKWLLAFYENAFETAAELDMLKSSTTP